VRKMKGMRSEEDNWSDEVRKMRDEEGDEEGR
jgi:hypothetical protein